MVHNPSESITPDQAQQRMRTASGTHISQAEWQWVIYISCALVLLAFAPLILFSAQGTDDVQFMGMTHNYLDGGTYLSKMQLGVEGRWFVTFEHTPEQHQGGFIQVIYLLLGHLSRLSGVPTLVIFHVARLGASLLMYFALYQLGAAIWTKVRARKVFFAIAAIGSGFGWLFSLFTGSTDFPDLTLPEAFPFYSSIMNVHFPLTLALLAMLLTILINVLRPGAEQDTQAERAVPLVSGLSLGLALLFPQTLVPVGAALAFHLLVTWVKAKKFPIRLMRWMLAIGVPAFPLFVYYVFLVMYNPAMAEWNRQNVTLAPPLPGGLLIVLAGFGLPLLLALPGIWRALRRLELDGDRLMLFWLLAMLILIFMPTNIQRRFAAGMIIPIAYFATRAIEDVWLNYVSRRRRTAVFTLVMAILPISQLFVLLAPVALFGANPQNIAGIMLDRSYIASFQWLRENSEQDDVILAATEVGIWIPGYTGDRVVYAHKFETLNADRNREALNTWYQTTEPDQCAATLQFFEVAYILFGPEERKLSDAPVCLEGRELLAQIGQVAIYAP